MIVYLTTLMSEDQKEALDKMTYIYRFYSYYYVRSKVLDEYWGGEDADSNEEI